LAAFEKVLGGGPADSGEVMLAAARQALARAALGYARSAHAHGRAELEPVDEYLAFAARVWPEARPLRHARARRQALVRGLHRLAEDLGARARWRRWRWSGV
jgi:hypothetical protein